MSYWRGKLAIVVGGSSGLGLHLAEELVSQGAQVVLVARNEDALKKATDALNTVDANSVSWQRADVTNWLETEDTWKALSQQHERIDAVFNCVGKSTRESVLDVDAEKMKEMMKVNLHATINVAMASIPLLRQTSGHLVHIGSLASKTAWPWVTSYAVSKTAMATYTHQLRLEGPSDVHYMLVCPGPIARDDTGHRYDDETENLPPEARKGGAGANIKGIQPKRLVKKILMGCQRRKRELIVPGYARIAFIASAISPVLGDWILRKKMSK